MGEFDDNQLSSNSPIQGNREHEKTLITAIPPDPGGVEMAQMVFSCSLLP